MATKSDYTDDEWQILKFAVMDTMAYLTLANPGFWETFKEANAAARYIGAQRDSSASLLIRDLAADTRGARDKEATANPADMTGEVTARIHEAAALVAAKDYDDLPAFKDFILGVAHATAEAADGVVENEAEAIAKITTALD